MTICHNLWVLALCKDNKALMVEVGGVSAYYCKRIIFSSVSPLVNTTNSFQFLFSFHLPQGLPKPLFKGMPSPLPFLLSTEFIWVPHLITLLFFLRVSMLYWKAVLFLFYHCIQYPQHYLNLTTHWQHKICQVKPEKSNQNLYNRNSKHRPLIVWEFNNYNLFCRQF